MALTGWGPRAHGAPALSPPRRAGVGSSPAGWSRLGACEDAAVRRLGFHSPWVQPPSWQAGRLLAGKPSAQLCECPGDGGGGAGGFGTWGLVSPEQVSSARQHLLQQNLVSCSLSFHTIWWSPGLALASEGTALAVTTGRWRRWALPRPHCPQGAAPSPPPSGPLLPLTSLSALLCRWCAFLKSLIPVI